jgi:hypothetical protein
MKAVEFIRTALEMSATATLALIDDMRDALLTFPTPNGGNHPLWVLGHLAWSEGDIVQQAMLGRPSPVAHWKGLFGIGSEPAAEAARYPTLEELRRTFQDLRAETLRVLATLTDVDLDAPSKGCPPEFQRFLGTYAQCLLVTVFNTLNHRGQVADARRALGRKPLRF